MRMNGALLWSSKILKIVADSTAHAETAEASRSVKSGTFVRMVCEGVGRPAVGRRRRPAPHGWQSIRAASLSSKGPCLPEHSPSTL